MAQTTIWLPGDLRQRAKAAGLNMSAICARALEEALLEKAVRKHPAYKPGDLFDDYMDAEAWM